MTSPVAVLHVPGRHALAPTCGVCVRMTHTTALCVGCTRKGVGRGRYTVVTGINDMRSIYYNVSGHSCYIDKKIRTQNTETHSIRNSYITELYPSPVTKSAKVVCVRCIPMLPYRTRVITLASFVHIVILNLNICIITKVTIERKVQDYDCQDIVSIIL